MICDVALNFTTHRSCIAVTQAFLFLLSLCLFLSSVFSTRLEISRVIERGPPPTPPPFLFVVLLSLSLLPPTSSHQFPLYSDHCLLTQQLTLLIRVAQLIDFTGYVFFAFGFVPFRFFVGFLQITSQRLHARMSHFFLFHATPIGAINVRKILRITSECSFAFFFPVAWCSLFVF